MKELALINHILKQNPQLPDSVTLPPGDDMAALRLADSSLLVATDQIAQDVHFLLDESSDNNHLKRIGHKSLARNLSDIAAMAAKPVACLLSMLLPPWLSDSAVITILEGLRDTASKYSCPLVGGDTGNWPVGSAEKLVLNVTVLAQPWPEIPILTRQGAIPGDGIFVSGTLGGSLIEKETGAHHLTFTPRIELAKQLAATGYLHAMLDLSDGLASDARRFMQFELEASSIRLQIQPAQLPISASAEKASQSSGQPPHVHALSDGEDYELLFTAPLEQAQTYQKIGNALNIPISLIGRVLPATSQVPADLYLEDPDGEIKPLSSHGFEHI